MRSGIDSKILKVLEEERKKEGTLPELLEFFYRLLQIQSGVGKRIDVPNPSFTSDEIKERAVQGKPLIGFDDLALDWPLLRKTFGEVVATFASYADLFGPLPQQFTESGADNFITKKTIKAWYGGTKLPSIGVTTEVNEALIKDIILATLKPFLVGYSAVLLDLVEHENWRRGYCPVCGGNPDFCFLDTERGAKWLVCSRCDAEWLFQRLQCPYCGTTDQNALSYFTDDEGLYRLYVCEQCKHYMKTIDLRQAKSGVLIPLERLYTLDMDKQARELGYSPCD